LADFLEFEGEWRLERRVGVEWGEGMGSLGTGNGPAAQSNPHRHVRPSCARARFGRRPSSFPGALPLVTSLSGIDPNVSQLENTPAVPPHNFSFEILFVL